MRVKWRGEIGKRNGEKRGVEKRERYERGRQTLRQILSGSQRYSVILSTLIHPIVRTARALIRGFGSSQSYRNNNNKLIN